MTGKQPTHTNREIAVSKVEAPRVPTVRKALKRASIRCLALVCVALPSQVAQANELKQVLIEAYQNNTRLEAARATQRANDENVSRAHAGFRPVITGNAEIGYRDRSTDPDVSTSGITRPSAVGVGIVQPLFRGFRIVSTVAEAEANVRAGRETLREVEQAVLLEAATAYFDVLRDATILRLRQGNVQILTRDVVASRKRASVGQATKTDVLQADARRAGALSSVQIARANLEASRSTFERIVGRKPIRLGARGFRLPQLPRNRKEIIDTALSEHPTVAQAIYQEQAAKHAVRRIRGELLPSAQLEADYRHRRNEDALIRRSNTASVFARLTVPIYTGGEVDARVRQAKQTQIARRLEIETARRQVRERAQAAWARFVASRAALRAVRRQVDFARGSLAGVRKEHSVGQRTLLDILNAEQELLTAKISAVSNARNEAVAAYTVMQAIGRLSIANIDSAVDTYDARQYYKAVRRKWGGITITYRNGRVERIDTKRP